MSDEFGDMADERKRVLRFIRNEYRGHISRYSGRRHAAWKIRIPSSGGTYIEYSIKQADINAGLLRAIAHDDKHNTRGALDKAVNEAIWSVLDPEGKYK